MVERFIGFRSLAAEFERHLEASDHPDRGGIGNAFAFLALRKHATHPKRLLPMQAIALKDNNDPGTAHAHCFCLLV